MSQLFDTLIIQPFAYILNFILNLVGSYGLAIIVFTIVTKFIMVPFQVKSKKAMLVQRRLTPKMKALEKKYKDDKAKYNEEMQRLYDEEGFNPMSGCLPTLITLPILIGLYGVITKPLTNLMHLVPEKVAEIASRLGIAAAANGSFNEIVMAEAMHGKLALLADICPNLFEINFGFLGFNLSQTPLVSQFSVLWILPIVSALTGFLSMLLAQKYMPAADPSMASTNTMMNLTMPIMSLVIGFSLPTGVTLYWITGNLFTMAQEPVINYYLSKGFYAELEARDRAAQKKKKKKPLPESLPEPEPAPEDQDE